MLGYYEYQSSMHQHLGAKKALLKILLLHGVLAPMRPFEEAVCKMFWRFWRGFLVGVASTSSTLSFREHAAWLPKIKVSSILHSKTAQKTGMFAEFCVQSYFAKSFVLTGWESWFTTPGGSKSTSEPLSSKVLCEKRKEKSFLLCTRRPNTSWEGILVSF